MSSCKIYTTCVLRIVIIQLVTSWCIYLCYVWGILKMLLLTWYSSQFKVITIELHFTRIQLYRRFNNICRRPFILTEDRKLITPHGNIFVNYMLPPTYAWSKNLIEDINNETEDTTENIAAKYSLVSH